MNENTAGAFFVGALIGALFVAVVMRTLPNFPITGTVEGYAANHILLKNASVEIARWNLVPPIGSKVKATGGKLELLSPPDVKETP